MIVECDILMEQEARLSGLDELRSLAIGLVVLSHVGPVFAEGGTVAALLFAPAWSVGVDLFFVISGLVVERSLRSLRHERGALEAASAFYVRRAMRIVPLAWCVGAILSIGLIIPGSGVEPADAKAAFAFISNAHWAPCFGGAAGCGNAFASRHSGRSPPRCNSICWLRSWCSCYPGVRLSRWPGSSSW